MTKQDSSRKPSEEAVAFFREHAGYSYGAGETPDQGRTRGAITLARAEAGAKEHGWYTEWRSDEEPCIGCECGSFDCPCFTGESHETLGAILYDDQERVLGSLGSICEPSKEYCRMIEAELADEAFTERFPIIESVV